VLAFTVFNRAETPSVLSPLHFKGTISFKVEATRGNHTFEVEPRGELRLGDVLAFSATTDAPGYLSIFFIDALGNAVLLFPNNGGEGPWRATAAGDHELPGTQPFESAARAGVFAAVFSESKFDIAKVREKMSAVLRGTEAKEMLSGRKKLDALSCDFLEVQRID
jgi:hypothetical protein